MAKYLFIALILFHLFLLINLQFTAWPEMFSFPYLVNNGYEIYTDFVHAYPLLLTVILSRLFSITGYSLLALQLFTWGIILINDILIFLITKEITKSKIEALVAVFFYAILQPFLDGNMLWFDLGIVPFILGGAYTYILATNDKNNISSRNLLMLSGLLFTLAVFVKQNAIIFPVAVTIILILSKEKLKSVAIFLFPPLFIGILFLFSLQARGSLNAFLNWTLLYPSKYWTAFPGYVEMSLSMNQAIVLFLLLIPSLPFLLKFRKLNRHALVVFLFIILGIFAIYPRFSYFHFQTAFAFIGILIGIIFTKQKYLIFAVYFFILIILIARPIMNRGREARFWGTDEKQTAEFIININPNNEKIMLIGLPSQLYVMSNTLPPKPWVDTFGWYLEIPGVQEELITKWNSDMPLYIFESHAREGNWYDLATYRPTLIMEWVRENYTLSKTQEDYIVWKRNN